MVVRNLALDPVTNDVFRVAGRLQLVSDGPAVAQAVGCALRTFLGEWFLDSTPPKIGVPYFQQVLVKSPDSSVLRSVFTAVIEGVTGVARVTSMQLKYNTKTRALAVVWAATTNLGALISGTTGI